MSGSEAQAQSSNAEQSKYWNEVAGPKWVALDSSINSQIEPLGMEAMERLAVKPGERLLDVGCGCGHTTHELGRRVGAGGEVLGLDLSEPMLERARGGAPGAWDPRSRAAGPPRSARTE